MKNYKIAAPLAACFLFIAACGSPASSEGPDSGGGHANWVEITTDSLYRYIRSNAIPDHDTGAFPNDHNPHTIAPQNIDTKIWVAPALSGYLEGDHMMWGIALNGVPFFPSTAEYWNRDANSGWNYEALSGAVDLGLDHHNAHVQPNGMYHYHGLPSGLIEDNRPGEHSRLIGYALDGFPVYAQYGYSDAGDVASGVKELSSSYRLRPGARTSGPGGAYDGTFVEDYEYAPGWGDLDECNGRQGVTPEYPSGTYAYFLTARFPFIPRCFKGSLAQRPPGGP